jgi:hypothetical protein
VCGRVSARLKALALGSLSFADWIGFSGNMVSVFEALNAKGVTKRELVTPDAGSVTRATEAILGLA